MTDETGLMYRIPHATPPIKPYPVYIRGRMCCSTPTAVVQRAAHQVAAPTVPALRGPTLSTHLPKKPVAIPRDPAARENTGIISETLKSEGAAVMTPIDCVIGKFHMVQQ